MTKTKRTKATTMVGSQVGQRTKRKARRPQSISVAITAPAASAGILRNRAPMVRSNGASTITEHCEPIQDVGTGSALALARVDLTPSTFPWLNTMAQNFSKFKWHYLQLFYIPSCPTTTPGSVAVGLTYDDLDSSVGPGITFNQIAVLNRSVVAPVWAGASGSAYLHRPGFAVPPDAVCVEVDTDKLDKPYYKYATQAQLSNLIQNAQGLAASSIYIPCSYNLAITQGAAAGTLVGRVFAKYRIELIEPVPAALNA